MYKNAQLVDVIEDENFTFTKISHKKNQKFNTESTDYKIKFKNIPYEVHESLQYMMKIMVAILNEIVANTLSNDMIKIYINHPALDTPIVMGYVKAMYLDAELLMEEIAKVVQSNRILTLDDNMTFHTQIIHYLSGGGGRSKRLENFLFKKQSVIRIKSNKNDKLCALRAIVVGKAVADKIDRFKLNEIKDSRNSFQSREAIQLALKLNLPLNKEIGLNELQAIENYLEHYQFIVFDGDSLNSILYVGPKKDKKILLYYNSSHFDTIISLHSFFNKRFYCYTCMKPYSNFENHPCNKVCKKCKNKNCQTGLFIFRCNVCLVNCNSEKCLLEHKKKICGRIPKCDVCGVFKVRTHVCNGKWCYFCKESVSYDHKCYILTEDENELKETSFDGYIFFDYEAMQAENVHVVNLVVARKMCKLCLNHKMCTSDCGLFTFYDNDSFCEWLFIQNRYTAIAHNMRSYDGYFIMNYIVNNLTPVDKKPECILSGSKLLVIKYSGVKIIDSLNFIPLALSKFPKTFGFNELKKGYFPHFFNKPENQNYVGLFPSQEFYGAEFLSVSENKAFNEWYNSQHNKIFDFKKEILEYCISDVEILCKSCLIFRNLFISITKKHETDSGVDPFLNCLTIASACHYVFRRNFMPSKSIGLIPAFGYNSSDTCSYFKSSSFNLVEICFVRE